MGNLQVETGGKTATFQPSKVITLGRDLGSDVVLTGNTTSRRHAELRPDPSGGWVLIDTGSSSGTYLNGTRVTEVRINGRVEIRFGSVDGESVVVTDLANPAPARPEMPAMPAAGMPVGMEQTIVPGHGPAGQGGMPGFGPGVLIKSGGTAKRFNPGVNVRVGRDPANEVVIDDPSVSRLHATVEMRSDGWWFFDRSTAGTFDEEDRVTQLKLSTEHPTVLMLGHPTAGAEIEIIPIVAAAEAQKAIAGKKRRSTATKAGIAVGVLALVGGGTATAVVLSGDDEPTDTGLSAAERDRAKAASVWILATDESGEPIYTGSGSLISDDGLILTNAHVGKPSAPGQQPPAEDPASLLIAFPPADDLDGSVEIRFTAEPIVADGVLDLAVLQITGDEDGEELSSDELDLPEPMPLGDSDKLSTSDNITAMGFPAVAAITLSNPEERGLSVTGGEVSTFLNDDTIGERAWIDSDVRIGSGNSGGASINDDGELIGINSAVVTAGTAGGQAGEFTGGSALIRPVALAADIIEIARDGGDPDYVSPFLDDMDTPDPADGDADVQGHGWSQDGDEGCDGSGSETLPLPSAGDTVHANFSLEGVTEGTPIELAIFDLDGNQVDSVRVEWDGYEGCAPYPFEFPGGEVDGLVAVFTVGDLVVENPVLFQ